MSGRGPSEDGHSITQVSCLHGVGQGRNDDGERNGAYPFRSYQRRRPPIASAERAGYGWAVGNAASAAPPAVA